MPTGSVTVQLVLFADLAVEMGCDTPVKFGCVACSMSRVVVNGSFTFTNEMHPCHILSGETIRTNKKKRGDTRNKEYMEMIKEQTQNRK